MSLLDSLLLEGVTDPPVVQKDIWIALRTDGIQGAGTEDNPRNGSDPDDLDFFLSTMVGSNVSVHFGPGLFQTRGFPAANGFAVKSGQRFIGSGMNSTTLKLIDATAVGGGYIFGCPSYGGGNVKDVQISDMTLDANLWGQANSTGEDYPRIVVGGIGLFGSNIRVRRVRVINFGTNTPFYEYNYPNPNYPPSSECFPLFLGMPSGGSANNLIENCLLEQPGTNTARETTCMNISGGAEKTGTGRGQSQGVRGRREKVGAKRRRVAVVEPPSSEADFRLTPSRRWKPARTQRETATRRRLRPSSISDLRCARISVSGLRAR